MIALPRGKWTGKNTVNEYHIVAFDPGGITGWAHLVLDYRAFSRPEHKVLPHLKSWDSGAFTGPETEQIQSAANLVWGAHFGDQYNSRVDAVSEDFNLTQIIGGEELLSPVRINAVLAWECIKQGLRLILQNRALRVGQTKERIQAFGFTGKRFQKDEFAALQHAVTRARLVKRKSISQPWKLSDGVGRYWDCNCADGNMCDLRHS